MTDIDKLRAEFEQTEAKAQNLMAEKDDAVQKVREKYADKLRDLNNQAAAVQKKLNDAEAAQGIADRDDLDDDGKQRLAENLGLTLP